MNDLSVIDQFLQAFIRYIDSGFGLLGGDVSFLSRTLIALDITLWGIADPMNSIIECNDANNVTEGPDLDCDTGVK